MRQIWIALTADGKGTITVDDLDLSKHVSAISVLSEVGQVPVVQLEIRGEIQVEIPEGLVELMPDGDHTGALTAAIEQIDPAGLEQAILSHLGGLDEATTGEAAKRALLEWARGHGSA
jgi:hypothetical protein